jgi:beta-glucosidase
LSVDVRVDDLISRMTLEEKISQMVVATVYPQAIGLAATWNTALVRRVAETISDEARAKHHEAVRRGVREIFGGLTFWSPNINIFRDPRWGRGQETYGEDPYLTARMGVAFVKGLQGNDPRYLKLVATPKHFAVHSGPEPDRHHFNAHAEERDLWQTYLPAFEACVKEGKAASVMGAYNRTNGEPCCASPTLLDKILREKWQFSGYVVSDCWAIRDLYEHHKVAETAAEAAAMAVNAGCDLNCGCTYPALIEAVEEGLIDEATIDRAVKRLFRARFRLGMFDPPEQVAYARIPYEINDSQEHRALALQAARESIVLLKNECGFLPLSRDLPSIAVVGPNADDLKVLLGNYRGTPSRAVTPLEGIRQKVSPATKVYYAQGCDSAAGAPTLQVIPTAFLRPIDPDAEQSGLTTAYYKSPEFGGEPILTRVDPVVDFTWKGISPLTGRMGDPLAIRWTGTLIAPFTGSYMLGVRGFGLFSLFLDGKLVVKSLPNRFASVNAKGLELEAGRLYDLQLEYVNQALDSHVQLLWAVPGVDYWTQALEVAQKADVVVMVMGLTPELEEEEIPIQVEGFLGGDRTDITLPSPQETLLRRIHAVGKPIVLVLLNGSALGVNWAAENVPAIVEAWYPGQAGGTAIADVLFGDCNPGGRLPITFYKSVDDLPPFADYRMDGRTYRYFRGEPLFPFGHGLSYTTFAYRDLHLSAETIAPDEILAISVDVQNVGEHAGDEVVQLYTSDVEASAPVPIRQLQAFERIHLIPGERKTTTFTLTPRQLSLIDDEGRRVIEPGEFQVFVGGRQPMAADLTGDHAAVLIGSFEVIGPVAQIER